MVYAGVILEENGKILLQLRDLNANTSNPGLWGIFGGGIENGENPEQTVIREIREELNITLKKDALIPIIRTRFNQEICYIFRYSSKLEFSKLRLNEGKEMKLFSKKEILDLCNVVPGLKELTKRFL